MGFTEMPLMDGHQIATGRPVGLVPIAIVKARDGHAPAGGGMGKFHSPQIDAHVSAFMGDIEENQVSRAQLRFVNPLARLHLQGRGPWNAPVKKISIQPLHKPRAVNPMPAGAPHPVRCSFPLQHLGPDPLFDRGRIIDRCYGTLNPGLRVAPCLIICRFDINRDRRPRWRAGTSCSDKGGEPDR